MSLISAWISTFKGRVLKKALTPERRREIIADAQAVQGVSEKALLNEVTLDLPPGKPTHDAFIESFNGRLYDECLNAHWFLFLADAGPRSRLETALRREPSSQISWLDDPVEYMQQRS